MKGNIGGRVGGSGNNTGSSGAMGMMNNGGGSSGGMEGMDRSMDFSTRMKRGMGGGIDSRMGGSMDRTGGELDRGTRDSMVMGMSSFGMREQSDNMGGGAEEIGRSRGLTMSNNSGGSNRGSNIINSMEREKVRERSASLERRGEGIDSGGLGNRRRMDC